jgi:paraquat-inducible protein A
MGCFERAMTIGCPECGALEDLPRVRAPYMTRCRICRFPLERTAGRSVAAALACSLTVFVLLIAADLAPLMSVRLDGLQRSEALGAGLAFMWSRGWVLMAVLLTAFGVVLPLVRFAGLTAVLATVFLGRRPSWLGPTYRWVMQLDLWAMPDVFLVGFFIGMSRVAQHMTVQVGAGGWCFIAAALLTMVTRATLDRRSLWRMIGPPLELSPGQPAVSCTVCDFAAPAKAEGEPCPRCGLRLRARKPDALLRATVLSLAALVLYVPANLYPMTISIQLWREVPRRIITGVVELFQAGFWPLGVIIFCTSIAIPLLKILSMFWFVLSVKLRSRRHLRFKTHLHRIVDELGRWSNVDVFTLAIFLPLIRFGNLASARAAPGATAFTLVVFLTMVASRCFDPRLMWDAAERARG